nr:UDP-N-acetylglucosamine 4,6-dehydratase (inverting) [uncultured Anaeromusa sp.]
MFNEASLLITGGTGTFGRQLVQTLLARYRPRRVIVFSRDELKQSEMQREFPQSCMRYFIGDVRDEGRLHQALQGVDYVVHAAALKQVPTAECNPSEFVKTNILGAQHMIAATIANRVKKVIDLSSDKAANPTSFYGATKLVSDKLFVAANESIEGQVTQFSVVRYGNIAASRGSVVPLFRRLLAEGCTRLPVTHLQMTRFWLTPAEGVEAMLAAFSHMRGGEIFIPKVPSCRIVQLAEAFLPGREPEIIGLRPGEKLHEAMWSEGEAHLVLEFPGYYLLRPPTSPVSNSVYAVNSQGESGKAVPDGFIYNSAANPQFLSVAELQRMLKEHK